MHLPAVQISSYIAGAQARIVRNGRSLKTMWCWRDRSLAASQAASGVPAKSPTSPPSGSTTSAKQSLGSATSAPARSTTFRTAVHLLPMIFGVVMTAPSQWKKFRISRPGHAGEEVLVAAGEADDFVGKDRSDDDDVVVVEQQLVDLDRHIHREQTAGQVADLVGGDGPDLAERGGIVPGVVEEAHAAVAAASFGLGDLAVAGRWPPRSWAGACPGPPGGRTPASRPRVGRRAPGTSRPPAPCACRPE